VSRSLSISSRFSNLFVHMFLKYSQMIPWISLMFVVISPFSLLILLNWVFPSLFQSHFPVVCLSCLSFQRTSFLFHCFFYRLFVSISLISALIFIISQFLLLLSLTCSCLPRSLWCSTQSFIWIFLWF
jgi:hypothetical protein